MTSVSVYIENLPTSVRNVAQERVAEVYRIQRQFGMEPRDDSILTIQYATGQLSSQVSAESIAKELIIVDRIHKETAYSTILEETMRKVTNFMHQRFPHIMWGDLWKITRIYLPEIIKLYCIRVSGKQDTLMLI